VGKSLSSCHLNNQRLINPLEAEVDESAHLIESTGVTPPYKISRFHRESLQLNHETHVGEIGLNAVHPQHACQGIGTSMYDFAVARMTEAGMQAATVATGGDASHAPARRAYAKAGFTVQIPSVWLCRRL
jgi:GNAT superfamily N-acetyltransferase